MLDTDWPTQLKIEIMSVSSLPSLEIITLIMTSSLLQSKLNTNRYATKKTIAQGMLDIALLSSNAAQLKYILTVSGFLQQSTLMNWSDQCLLFTVQVGEEHQYYLPMLILIVSSIVLQVSFRQTIVNNILNTTIWRF